MSFRLSIVALAVLLCACSAGRNVDWYAHSPSEFSDSYYEATHALVGLPHVSTAVHGDARQVIAQFDRLLRDASGGRFSAALDVSLLEEFGSVEERRDFESKAGVVTEFLIDGSSKYDAAFNLAQKLGLTLFLAKDCAVFVPRDFGNFYSEAHRTFPDSFSDGVSFARVLNFIGMAIPVDQLGSIEIDGENLSKRLLDPNVTFSSAEMEDLNFIGALRVIKKRLGLKIEFVNGNKLLFKQSRPEDNAPKQSVPAEGATRLVR